MIFKKVSLLFDDCYANVEITNDGDDTVTLSIKELGVDREKSTTDITYYETLNVTTIHLGVEETEELINSLKYVIPKE